MRSPAIVFAASAAALTVLLAWFGAATVTRMIETDAENRIGAALAAAGLDWAEIDANGLEVALLGTAPSEKARFTAIEAAARIVDTKRIQDRIAVESDRADSAPDFSLEILRNGSDLSLIGLVPGTEARLAVISALDDVTADGHLTDLLEAVSYDAPDAWAAAMEAAISLARDYQSVRLQARPGEVHVEVFLPAGTDRTRALAEIEDHIPDSVSAEIVLTVPMPVIAPFVFAAERGADGFDVTACSADSDAALQRIETQLADLGIDEMPDCALGLGAPTPRWSIAVAAGLEALEAIGAGTLDMRDADVILTGPMGTDPVLWEKASRDLRAALPDMFSLSAPMPPPMPDPETAPPPPPEFVATRDGDGQVTMNGPVRDPAARDALTNLAAARFGTENVDAFQDIDGTVPEGWTLQVLGAIEALALLREGRVTLGDRDDETVLDVAGVTDDPETEARLREVLGGRLPDLDVAIALTVVEPVDPVPASPSAQECERQLAGILGTRQIIFAPSSSTISDESAEVLDEIAFVINTCAEARFEIGGHTDSQGREAMNLALSQARADAVLDSLLAREVMLAKLEAKGYGESQPIADNETDAGRAQNRRIEFRLIVAEDETSEDGDAPSDAPGADDGAAPEADGTPPDPAGETPETAADPDGAAADTDPEADPEVADGAADGSEPAATGGGNIVVPVPAPRVLPDDADTETNEDGNTE